jgi:hypothetical protein
MIVGGRSELAVLAEPLPPLGFRSWPSYVGNGFCDPGTAPPFWKRPASDWRCCYPMGFEEGLPCGDCGASPLIRTGDALTLRDAPCQLGTMQQVGIGQVPRVNAEHGE